MSRHQKELDAFLTDETPDAFAKVVESVTAQGTPAVVTANGTTCQQRSVETTLAGLLDKAVLDKPAGVEPSGPLTGTLVAISSYAGEQQRPSEVARGLRSS